jgi:hypothetical protein
MIWVDGFCTVVPGGSAIAGGAVVVAAGVTSSVVPIGLLVPPDVVVPVGEVVWGAWSFGALSVGSFGEIVPIVTPGTGTPTCAHAAGATQVNKAQPSRGDQINCTRLALTVMGVAGHPGNGRIVGSKKVCTAQTANCR